jgi:YggT family protein
MQRRPDAAAAACPAAVSPLNERPLPGSGAAMRAILDVLLLVLQIYTYIIIIVAIMSWLIAFNVINVYNDVVRTIWNALNAVTEPLLKPIRNVLPALGGLDISPVILLLLIFLVQDIIERYVYPNVF